MEQKLPPLPVSCIAGHPHLMRGSRDMQGPTEQSNWVIPGKLLTGAWPGSTDFEDHVQIVSRILRAGISTFADLTEPSTELLPNYRETAAQLLSERRNEFAQRKLCFLACPIPDRGVAPDPVAAEFVERLVAELRAGNAIYLHSAQGHGRAGTFVALLLMAVRLYGVSVEEALTKSCHYHDYRIDNGGKASPTTLAQFEQVRRLHPHLIAMYQKDMSVLVPMLGSASQPSQLSTPQS